MALAEEFNSENVFFSAPSSPIHFNWDHSQTILPFSYDHKPDQDFDLGTQFDDSAPLFAEQLFDSGKIRPKNENPESKSKEFKKMKKVKSLSASLNQENQEDAPSLLRSSHSLSSWSRRWKIKEFLLFRSTSEGREGSGKTRLLKKNEIEEAKNLMCRSTAVVNSVHITKKRTDKSMSAHELHYIVNRQISEEMKRKTFLPYKRNFLLLGC